jgi:hypothetical protein
MSHNGPFSLDLFGRRQRSHQSLRSMKSAPSMRWPIAALDSQTSWRCTLPRARIPREPLERRPIVDGHCLDEQRLALEEQLPTRFRRRRRSGRAQPPAGADDLRAHDIDALFHGCLAFSWADCLARCTGRWRRCRARRPRERRAVRAHRPRAHSARSIPHGNVRSRRTHENTCLGNCSYAGICAHHVPLQSGARQHLAAPRLDEPRVVLGRFAQHPAEVRAAE